MKNEFFGIKGIPHFYEMSVAYIPTLRVLFKISAKLFRDRYAKIFIHYFSMTLKFPNMYVYKPSGKVHGRRTKIFLFFFRFILHFTLFKNSQHYDAELLYKIRTC